MARFATHAAYAVIVRHPDFDVGCIADTGEAAREFVFYSNEDGNNRKRAEAYAESRSDQGVTTLERTRSGKWLDEEKLFDEQSPLNRAEAAAVWADTSQKYAEAASGEVRCFVTGSNPNSIFRQVELPVLLDNPAVTAINGLPREALKALAAINSEEPFRLIEMADRASRAAQQGGSLSYPGLPQGGSPVQIAAIANKAAAALAGGGMPAARIGDMHICPMVTPGTPPIPHVGGPILPPGAITVLVGGMPAARVGDMAVCVGPPDTIAKGSMSVLIGGKPAARLGDSTIHGGVIVVGLPTVLIGDSSGGGSGGAGSGSGAKTLTMPALAVRSVSQLAMTGPDKASRRTARKTLVDLARNNAAQLPRDQATKVRETAARFERDMEAAEQARLSQHVYSLGSKARAGDPSASVPAGTPAPEGWKMANPKQLAVMGLTQDMLTPPGSDFRAAVYLPDPAVFGEDAKPVIAFKGTESGSDWWQNLKKGVGLKSEYYESAKKIGQAAAGSGVEFEVVGHSLGGGLASQAAIASGKAATTFNSAGLRGATGLNNDTIAPEITAYRVEGEILTYVQEDAPVLRHLMPDAVGTPVTLQPSNPQLSRMDKHGMNVVVDSVEQRKAGDHATLSQSLEPA